jgi:hypothetical protein
MKLGMQLRIDAGVDTFWALRCVREFLKQGLDKNPRNVCLFADTEGECCIYCTGKTLVVRDNSPRQSRRGKGDVE